MIRQKYRYVRKLFNLIFRKKGNPPDILILDKIEENGSDTNKNIRSAANYISKQCSEIKLSKIAGKQNFLTSEPIMIFVRNTESHTPI